MTIPSGLLGALLAFGSAISFAGNRAFASKPLVKSDPVLATYITLLVGVPVVAASMLTAGEEGTLLILVPLALVVFALVGVFHFAIGRQLSYVAEKHIGANQAAPLISTQIVYSVVLAIVLLGERINLGIGVGTVLVILGIMLLEVKSSAEKRGGSPKKGYVASIATAIIFGITPLLIKYGLSKFDFYASATFIAYVAGLVFYSLTKNPSSVVSGFRELPRYALLFYVLSGVFAAIGQLFRFAALSFAPVVIVIPILASHPVFTYLMTRKLAKEYEVFRTRTIGAMVVVVAGTIVVSLYSGTAP